MIPISSSVKVGVCAPLAARMLTKIKANADIAGHRSAYREAAHAPRD
jgi:hypothetical protein